MNRTNVRDFTEGNISKQLLTFALPLFMSNLLQVAYNMLDMVIVGNVMGKVGTSAVAVGGDIAHLLTFVAMGFSSAGQVIIARYIGAKKRDRIGRFVGTMSFFLFASAIVLSAVGIVLRHELLGLMNTPEESYDGALAYSVISMIGLVFIYGYNAVSAILRGMGDSKHPFIFISLAAAIVCQTGDLILQAFQQRKIIAQHFAAVTQMTGKGQHLGFVLFQRRQCFLPKVVSGIKILCCPGILRIQFASLGNFLRLIHNTPSKQVF